MFPVISGIPFYFLFYFWVFCFLDCYTSEFREHSGSKGVHTTTEINHEPRRSFIKYGCEKNISSKNRFSRSSQITKTLREIFKASFVQKLCLFLLGLFFTYKFWAEEIVNIFGFLRTLNAVELFKRKKLFSTSPIHDVRFSMLALAIA